MHNSGTGWDGTGGDKPRPYETGGPLWKRNTRSGSVTSRPSTASISRARDSTGASAQERAKASRSQFNLERVTQDGRVSRGVNCDNAQEDGTTSGLQIK